MVGKIVIVFDGFESSGFTEETEMVDRGRGR